MSTLVVNWLKVDREIPLSHGSVESWTADGCHSEVGDDVCVAALDDVWGRLASGDIRCKQPRQADPDTDGIQRTGGSHVIQLLSEITSACYSKRQNIIEHGRRWGGESRIQMRSNPGNSFTVGLVKA